VTKSGASPRSAQARKRAGAKAAGPHGAPGAVSLADSDDRPLHRCVESALDAYFDALDGAKTCGLFDMVMCEVERPMLACVMRFVGDNQSRAAEVLGLSRGTLRKKLIRHGLLED
jgi:Fis family transcriptional regulator